MQIEVAKAAIVQALENTSAIVEKKSTMPILSAVLLEAKSPANEPEYLEISAYDLEVGIQTQVQAKIIKRGVLAIGGASLHEICKAMPEDVIQIVEDKNRRVRLLSGVADFKIVGLAPEEFPAIPSASKIEFRDVDAKILLSMFKDVEHAISGDETRYNLNGALLEQTDKMINIVATDGHRLAAISKPIVDGFEPSAKQSRIIIPRKGLKILNKLLTSDIESGHSGQMALGAVNGAPNALIYKSQNSTLTMRLIDGQFPDWIQVVPESSPKTFTINRQRLLSGLKRMMLISDGKIEMTLQKNMARLTANSADIGDAKEDIVIAYEGLSLTIGFNGGYLRDSLETKTTEMVEIGLQDELSPIVVKPSDDTNHINVIMPMR